MKHIAILRQPFYDMILRGEKTIESRWSQKKIAPYQKIKKGDTILFKLTGKDVTAKAKVEKVKFFELTPIIAEQIALEYGNQIGVEKFEDWQTTKQKRYCTLIWLKDVTAIEPIKVQRSNGAGWIVLEN